MASARGSQYPTIRRRMHEATAPGKEDQAPARHASSHRGGAGAELAPTGLECRVLRCFFVTKGKGPDIDPVRLGRTANKPRFFGLRWTGLTRQSRDRYSFLHILPSVHAFSGGAWCTRRGTCERGISLQRVGSLHSAPHTHSFQITRTFGAISCLVTTIPVSVHFIPWKSPSVHTPSPVPQHQASRSLVPAAWREGHSRRAHRTPGGKLASVEAMDCRASRFKTSDQAACWVGQQKEPTNERCRG